MPGHELLTAAEMGQADALAIASGVSGMTLMETAGAAVAEAAIRLAGGKVVGISVLCGPGNNGGDGFVAARHLLRAEARPTVLLTGAKAEDLKDDAARAHREWTQAGGKTLIAPDFPTLERVWRELEKPDLIVDAMLGTGSRGAPRDVMAAVIDAIAPLDVPVVAVDLPTGVDAGDEHELANLRARCGLACHVNLAFDCGCPLKNRWGVLHTKGYFEHIGGHGTIPTDWDQYLKFADLHFRR
jgi:NAD(P)H-hydrate epimerase